jgi:hypothetical protein
MYKKGKKLYIDETQNLNLTPEILEILKAPENLTERDMSDLDFVDLTKDELINRLTWNVSGYKLSKLEENKGVYDIDVIEKNIQNISALLQKKYPKDKLTYGILLSLVPKKFKRIGQCPDCSGRIDIIEFEDEKLKEFYGADTMRYCHKCGVMDYLD